MIKKNESQYYCEYHMFPLGVYPSSIKEPKLYIEMDYREGYAYSFYMVLPNFNEFDTKPKEDEHQNEVMAKYALGDGILVEENELTDVRRIDYLRNGCRIPLGEKSYDYSFCGIIRVILEGKEYTYKFYINFYLKKVITYRVEKELGSCVAIFTNPHYGEEIEIAPKYGVNYPVLKEDLPDDDKKFKLNIKRKQTTKRLPLPAKKVISFCISNPEQNKFYLLECIKNETIDKMERYYMAPRGTMICPYCHSEIKIKKSDYLEGSISCQGNHLTDASTNSVRKIKEFDKAIKKSVFCESDCIKSEDQLISFKEGYGRLFPERFLDKKNYKLLVVGCTRSGKSTYISRAFDIKNSSMSMEKITALINDYCDVKIAKIPSVNSNLEANGSPWHSEYLKSLSISASDNTFVAPTLEDDVSLKNPLILDIHNQSVHGKRTKIRSREGYISVYDIAGEHVEKDSDLLNKISSGNINSIGGVFFIISDTKDITNTNKAIQAILNAARKNNHGSVTVPIAILLSKFDMIEDLFDESCLCRREELEWYSLKNTVGRYLYEGSPLERFIDISSEEIKSYLKRFYGDLDSLFDNTFSNIKYFNVAAFSEKDAVMHKDKMNVSGSVIREENELAFETAPQRMELPIIWMLRQLRYIK